MATLFLVRHGQASFGEAVYDRLSSLGEEQSRRLGAYFAKTGQSFDAVYTGPRERQIRTAELALKTMRAQGMSFPEPIVVPELDEIGAEDVLQEHMPRLIAERADLRRMIQNFAYRDLLKALTGSWLRGELNIPGLESWEAFSGRVARGLRIVREGEGRGRRVIAFTSGGTIGASLSHILEVPPTVSLDMAQVIRNTSLTEVLFSGERLTLGSFNALPHLDEPDLVTYR